MKNLSVLLLIISFSAIGQISDKLEPIDVFDLEYVSDPQISPDGNRIIYTRNFKDIMSDRNLSNLWVINFNGTNNRPITTGIQNDYNPIWSGDGRQILYMSNKEGSSQLYLRWLDTGAESKLTNLQNSPGGISWSRDNKFIAFSMFVEEPEKPFVKMPAKPDGAKWNDAPKYIDDISYRGDGRGYLKQGYNQLFTLPADGGTPRQITSGPYNFNNPEWTADGKNLICTSNMHENRELEEARNSEIYSVSVAGGKITPLTTRKGPDGGPEISPDGKLIAYSGFDDRYQGYQLTQLYVMNPDGTNSRLISKGFDRDIQEYYWSGDNKGLYIAYDDVGNTKIANMDLNGKVSELTNYVGGLSLGRPYTAGTFSVTATGRYAYTLGGPDHPSDLGAGERNNVNRLTRLNDDLFAYKKLGKVEELWWESSFDKKRIHGWIVTPPDFDPSKKYPLILEIHGGPFAAYSPFFAAEIQLFAAAGYVVLYTNPRGSSSYGEEFGNLIHHDYPNHDYEDLMSGVDAAVAKGYVDETQLYVTGGSGGGVLTAWIVGHTNRFRAAVVAKPVINWYSFVLYSDGIPFFYKYWFPGTPWENLEQYMRRSPISYVGNVTTPTMLLTGESDFRTPIAESEQFYAALKIQKVETAMVRIPGASHGIASRPSNLIAKVQAILGWFEKYKE
jgi:acylaminoacyl-peptidase